MSEDETTPVVVCTLTEEQKEARPAHVRSTLVETYRETVERSDGYTHRFEGTDDSLEAVAAFVSSERHCCSFADYTIEVSPPYDETRLTITGPDGTKAVFDETMIDRLAEM